MDWSGGESQEHQAEPGALPQFPKIWIGYLLGVATLIAEIVAFTLHPELTQASAGAYPIKPLRAAWFHLIPIFSVYWVYKWPRELARFVNGRLGAPLMRPERTGWTVLFAFAAFLLLSRGMGMIALFWATSYLSRCLRLALAARTAAPAGPLPFS